MRSGRKRNQAVFPRISCLMLVSWCRSSDADNGSNPRATLQQCYSGKQKQIAYAMCSYYVISRANSSTNLLLKCVYTIAYDLLVQCIVYINIIIVSDFKNK